MTSYPRSAYKNPFPADVNRNNAKARGWGPGWPNCQPSKMKTVSGGDVRVTVRAEVAEMVKNLLDATDKTYNVKSGSTGAYNCRAIRGTNTASNHSWGLAVDINWNDNPMSSNFHSEIPPAVVKMWNDCGWFWGGFYNNRKDTMHFEYIGKLSDVKSDTAQAIKYNKGAVPSPPKPTTPPTTTPKWTAPMTDMTKRGDRTIKLYDRGVDVELLQRFLGLKPVDGDFGPATEAKVKTWQMSQDLPATGIVDEKSWAVIKKAVSGI